MADSPKALENRRHRRSGWYRCPAPWLQASEYLLMRSQWPFSTTEVPGDYVLQKNATNSETSLGKTKDWFSPISTHHLCTASPVKRLPTVTAWCCFYIAHSRPWSIHHPSPSSNATSSRKTSLTIPSLPISSGIRWSFLHHNLASSSPRLGALGQATHLLPGNRE